jgi:excisionase family DNA binding protein
MAEKMLKPSEFGLEVGGFSSQTVRRWIRENLVKAERAGKGGHFRIPASEVERFKRSSGERK